MRGNRLSWILAGAAPGGICSLQGTPGSYPSDTAPTLYSSWAGRGPQAAPFAPCQRQHLLARIKELQKSGHSWQTETLCDTWKVQHRKSLGESPTSCQAESEQPHHGSLLGADGSTALQIPRVPNISRLALDNNDFAIKLLRFISNLKENMVFIFFMLIFLSQ